MFESIELFNFQAHERKLVRFSPNVTTIVGPSDAGKSTIIRAVGWVCLNESSTEYLRDGAKFLKVKLKVDGHTVVRKKGGGNLYRVDKKNFRAFGSKVPEQVSSLLGITDLNFQTQFEPHFWLSKSAGQVSKELNSIIDLGQIDVVLSNVAKALRKAKTVVEVTEDRLSQAEQNKEKLSRVPDMDRHLKDLEAQQDYIDGMREKASSLSRLIQDVRKYQKAARIDEEFVKKVKSLILKGDKIDDLQQQRDSLRKIIGQVKQSDRLVRLPIPSLSSVSRLQDQVEQLHELIHDIRDQECLANQKCPTCGQELRG